MFAFNPAGNSKSSNTVTVTTVLTPTNFAGTPTAGSPTDTIAFTWTVPAITIGITGYTIAMSTSANMAGPTKYTVTGAATPSYNLPGVAKGKTYYFSIFSNTATGNSAWSPVIKIVTP